MNKEDLELIKKILTDQLEELLKGVSPALHVIKESDSKFQDPLDRASFDALQNMQLRIKNRESNLIFKIKGALERIEDGTFGICESCGDDIPLKRLMARPVTNKCIECKTKEESFEKVLGV